METSTGVRCSHESAGLEHQRRSASGTVRRPSASLVRGYARLGCHGAQGPTLRGPGPVEGAPDTDEPVPRRIEHALPRRGGPVSLFVLYTRNECSQEDCLRERGRRRALS